jgi:hypothetical protein
VRLRDDDDYVTVVEPASSDKQFTILRITQTVTATMEPLAHRLQMETAEITGMPLKARIARSFAASYRWNVRNLEGHWYGRSDQIWQDLTSPFPDMIVVPQYPLWLTHGDQDTADEEGDGEGDDDCDEEMDSDEESSRQPRDRPAPDDPAISLEPGDDDENCVEVNTTEDSVVTLPERNAAELLPDFVILHFRMQPLRPDHPRFLQLAGIRITHECCPIIIEQKRMPRRRRDVDLYDINFNRQLEERLYEAVTDLEHQCAYAFKRYRHALSIIAVAVAGDYWCHLSVPFNYVSPIDDEYTMVQSRWITLDWPPAVAFGTSQSDARLAELRNLLQRKARPNHF